MPERENLAVCITDVEQSLIEIRVNQTGARKKRATDKDSDG